MATDFAFKPRKPRPQNQPQYDVEGLRHAIETRGMSMAEAADHFGVSRNVIAGRVNRAGIKPQRKAGEGTANEAWKSNPSFGEGNKSGAGRKQPEGVYKPVQPEDKFWRARAEIRKEERYGTPRPITLPKLNLPPMPEDD